LSQDEYEVEGSTDEKFEEAVSIEEFEQEIENETVKQEDTPTQMFSIPLFPPESYRTDDEQLIPAISPYQNEDVQIFNISALGAFDQNFIRLHEYAILMNEQEEREVKEELQSMDFSEVEPSDKVSRILFGLQEITEKFRDNLYNIIDPEVLSSRKERRLLKKKSFMFQRNGFKDMVKLMEKHMTVLHMYGKYPEETFKNFKECAKKALESDNESDALSFGMDVLLCAEAVMPMEETVVPRKRISEGIATPSSSMM